MSHSQVRYATTVINKGFLHRDSRWPDGIALEVSFTYNQNPAPYAPGTQLYEITIYQHAVGARSQTMVKRIDPQE